MGLRSERRSRLSPGGAAASGGGSRLSPTRGSLPRNACWAFAKGSCTRPNCKFDHVNLDERNKRSLTTAVGCITECENRWVEGTSDDTVFGKELTGILHSFPVLAPYEVDIWGSYSEGVETEVESTDHRV